MCEDEAEQTGISEEMITEISDKMAKRIESTTLRSATGEASLVPRPMFSPQRIDYITASGDVIHPLL